LSRSTPYLDLPRVSICTGLHYLQKDREDDELDNVVEEEEDLDEHVEVGQVVTLVLA
jgi:hypothetical protein